MKTAPKERPILFSSEMVRAILEGRKTQTRRIVKPQPYRSSDMPETIGWYKDRPWHIYYICNGRTTTDFTSPYGKPGDRLWVRETWADVTACFGDKDPDESPWNVAFKADNSVWNVLGKAVYLEQLEQSGIYVDKWKPSIHMHRQSSRITLEITNVRVERLQDISEEDAKAEGFDRATCFEFLDRAAGKIQLSENCYWLENEDTGDEDDGDNGYYCLPCAEARLKKLGKPWYLRANNCPETDGPAYCECGTPLLMSLTRYGIERELWLETFGGKSMLRAEDISRWPAEGMDARIAAMIADGYGDLREEHKGRLAQIGFATAWNLINGKKHPWESNPWVWVIEFRRVNAA